MISRGYKDLNHTFGKGSCTFCKQDIPPKRRAAVAMRRLNKFLIDRRYCSDECRDRHLEEVRAGAAERVRAYLAKKTR